MMKKTIGRLVPSRRISQETADWGQVGLLEIADWGQVGPRDTTTMSMEIPLIRRDVSADRPYAVIDEWEPGDDGAAAPVTTVFLTASQCPIGCNMCDLWQNTLSQPTPIGAIPRQLDAAGLPARKAQYLKLYNSGNFFDRRSIPPQDYRQIAQHCVPYRRVIVENHPKVGRDRVASFRDMIPGQLEVAVGLETVQPRWLERLGKGLTRDDFDRYADWLAAAEIDLRVFLMVGVPEIGASESIRWARLSLRHAISVGARHVSLIPARRGNGWNGCGDDLPHFSLDALVQLQADAIEDADRRAVVTIDLWDVQADPNDARQVKQRQQLERVNLSQQARQR